MEQYNRERDDAGGGNRNRYNHDTSNNRSHYEQFNRGYVNQSERQGRDDRWGPDLQQQFERNYRNSDYRDSDFRSSRNDYGRNEERDERFSHNRSRDEMRNNRYASDFMDNENRQGNIRQGYGISSFGGTSDRYNTLNSDQREGSMQEEQPYYTGSRDRLNSAHYGGGIGDAFPNSNRGVPNYGTRNFSDDYGSGLGSTYGGKNYGAGIGYEGGNRGGSFGNNQYGSSSGNYGGYGSMSGSSYGEGRGGSGGGSSHNSDRRSTGH